MLRNTGTPVNQAKSAGSALQGIETIPLIYGRFMLRYMALAGPSGGARRGPARL